MFMWSWGPYHQVQKPSCMQLSGPSLEPCFGSDGFRPQARKPVKGLKSGPLGS